MPNLNRVQRNTLRNIVTAALACYDLARERVRDLRANSVA
jgi:hypothetical protein